MQEQGQHQLTPEMVKSYSMEGNSIHYEMQPANDAGFRAPIIGGGMGVHHLMATLWRHSAPTSFDLDIYFRRPIFWDDGFAVLAGTGTNVLSDTWKAIGLVRNDKVLTEARINQLD